MLPFLLYRTEFVRGGGIGGIFLAEEKQGRITYSSLGQRPSEVAVGGIPSKVIDPPPPITMEETSGVGRTYVGVQHNPDGSEFEHLGPVYQR